jgi:transposase-like protein
MGKRTFKIYPEEFRRSSAKLAIESDKPISATAADLGINGVTLHGWVKKYYSANKSVKPAPGEIDPLVEIKRLKKENAQLKLEREILKKAAACVL